MRTKSAGRVPNAQLRQAFLDSGLSASEVASRIGWMRRAVRHSNQADGTKVRRLLGLQEYAVVRNGQRATNFKADLDEDDAVALGEVFGLDPWELGV